MSYSDDRKVGRIGLVEPLDDVGSIGNSNILRMIANSKAAVDGLLRFDEAFKVSHVLGPRLPQLVVLRMTALLGDDYNWGGRIAKARSAGVSDVEMRALRIGDLADFPLPEQIALKYVEAVEQATVTDRMWVEVSSSFATPELVELTVLAGFYGFICRVTRALEVPLEEGREGLSTP